MSLSSDLVVVTVPLSGALSAGAGVLRYPVPFNAELVRVDATVSTAPTGAALIFDVNKNGTTVFTNQASRPTVAINGTSASVLPSAPVAAATVGGAQPNDTGVGYANSLAPSVSNQAPLATFVPGDYVTVDVDQIGSTVAGSNAVVSLVLRKK